MKNHSETDNNITLHGVNSSSLLKAALYYADYTKVFPLSPGTKIPLFDGNWTAYATDDPLTIIDWWTEHPTANIAVVMNQRILVVDVDKKNDKDGEASFRELGIEQSPVFATTPNGGIHFFYRFPENRTLPFYNSTNKGAHGGIDIRSGNGYVVGAPSQLADGSYTLHNALSLMPVVSEQLAGLLDEWSTQAVAPFSDIPQPEILDQQTTHGVLTQLKGSSAFMRGKHVRFMLHGESDAYGGDGSAALMGVASALYRAGLGDDEVLSVLTASPHCMNVAFKRKKGSFEKQVEWLWRYSCLKARSSAPKNVAESTFEPSAQPEVSSAPESDEEEVVVAVAEEADLPTVLSRFRSVDDIDVLNGYLKRVVAIDDVLERDALIQRVKAHIKEHKIGLTFGALSQKVDELLRARRNIEPERSEPAFVHMNERGYPKGMTVNFKALMDFHKIRIRYNEMTHEEDVYIPNHRFHQDTMRNAQRSVIRDMMTHWDMPIERCDEYVYEVASQNAYHPVRAVLNNTVWDGEYRVDEVISCLHVKPEDVEMRDHLVKTWLASAIMALRDYGSNPPRGVLVLAGRQYTGKTSFFRAIAPVGTFAEGLHLDPSNKDSMIRSTKYWITELGELDATFRKSDISALKAHLSNTEDEIRTPFARKAEKYPRRTIYAGTVNDVEFLQDITGNSRYWCLETLKIDIPRLNDILSSQEDVYQFWKEVEVLFDRGQNYLLSQQEMRQLERHNQTFRHVSPIEDQLMNAFDWDVHPYTEQMTRDEILRAIGVVTSKGGGPAQLSGILRHQFWVDRYRGTRNGAQGYYYNMPKRINIFDGECEEVDSVEKLPFLD